ncbi:carbonic anhydrase [uncultured Aquimarina sp.]|uniref:carbonic anhydrase n=1 Tax=uncultured Aquimarina sp. TaxID=575652 RepID=UPI00262710B0|nr:carbonic anhydrase family protein [uncultured Aquimarina sp.]
MKLKTFKTLTILTLSIAVTSCNIDQNEQIGDQDIKRVSENDEMTLGYKFKNRSPSSDCNFEYEGFQGPEFWGDLCNGDWVDCNGNSQSPIDIVTGVVHENDNLNNINMNYTTSATEIFNNGHTIQFDYEAGSSASLNNIDYNLLQFHFHTGSEHTIDGKRYPMEMHLVHQDPVTKLLAVIGVFFKEGKENEVLAQFMNNLPQQKGDYYKNTEEYHIVDILPNEMEFYTYNGSLTTPACSEIVTWYVLKKPVQASHNQLKRFKEIMHENYRPTQPLNGRIVSKADD